MRTHENKTSDQALHTGLISSKPLLKYSHESIAKTFFCKLANFKEAALRQHRFPTLHFLTMLLLYVLPEPLSDRQTYCHYLPLHP